MILKCCLRLVTAVIAAAAIAAPAHDAYASEFKVGAITIETPWSRATPGR
jgi:copper(I)-binding protein